ncbi:EthD family reductase [Agaricicola taiwanensis]|uniref:EthD family reductase n=1 Tax=Agaricicola taiwanensis TaxID=591372 RepID=UPI001E5D3DA6|nr:EthD family reductase [Agaricicola taiwanensis]
MTFQKRVPSLTRSEFEQRWLTVHGPMAAVFPGLRGYMLGFSLDEGEPAADGIAQLWFDSRKDAQASYASDIGRRGSADASAWLARREHLLASEVWLTRNAPISETPFKLVFSVKRRDGMAREDFISWLKEQVTAAVAAEMGASQSRLSLDEAGLLLNSKVEGALDLVEGEGVHDALIELWFTSRRSAEEGRERFSAWIAATLAPQLSKQEDALLQEHVVVMPPAPAYGLDMRTFA